MLVQDFAAGKLQPTSGVLSYEDVANMRAESPYNVAANQDLKVRTEPMSRNNLDQMGGLPSQNSNINNL